MVFIMNDRVWVNLDNIENLYVQEVHCPYFYSNKWWEIRLYPYGTLARFDDIKECSEVYENTLRRIYEQNKTVVFAKPIQLMPYGENHER